MAFKVSLLSNFLALPRTCHLLKALHIFKYLDIHPDNDLNFDPMCHNVESNDVVKTRIQSMLSIYFDTQEYLPPNATSPRVRPIKLN